MLHEPQHAYTERTVTYLAAAQVKRIDDYRFATRKRSEAAAVRELLDLGLQAAARQGERAA
jgi:hypothetical protein